ncbi:energy transducer TonB [Pontibacter ruber]|uniref:TonB family protein n=1 Tax=Pontibacter ruber TaxID=1343895 RepID=A0ABW5CYA1_9BACT|nr:energy transducer TonB [Pontibacter ruber]
MPEFSGGVKGLVQYLSENVKYQANQPTGLAVVSFVVNTEGKVTNVHVVKGLSPEVDKECKRVVESMSGQWAPGVHKGQQVAVRYTLPIRFEEPAPVVQDSSKTKPAVEYHEVMPTYTSGMAELMKFLNKNKKYNKMRSPEGISQISFIVNEDGTLTDYKVVKSLTPELDQEAIRVLSLTSGNWKPGTQNDKPVKVRFTMPVRF